MMNEKMCYRCSDCGENWPMMSTYSKCPLCDEKCDPMSAPPMEVLTSDEAKALVKERTEEPPHKNQGLAQGEIGGSEGKVPTHSSIHGQKVFEHRYGFFMRLGFGPSESEALANTYEDTHHVRRMLERGCSIDQAFSILI